MLQQLKEALPDHPHVYKESLGWKETINKNWVERGSPYSWMLYEAVAKEQILVYVDYGYGFMAVFQNRTLKAFGPSIVIQTFDDYVVLDRDYYGTQHSVYKAV